MHSRRTVFKAMGSAAAFIHPIAVAGACQKHPNMVLIIGDDISMSDHGVYGQPTIKPPHINQLVANSLRLKNAYLTSPQCSSTRCSVITGRYPHNTGAPELHMPLSEGQVMFPRLLRENGYYTATVGKWHLGDYARVAFNRVADSRLGGGERWVEILLQRPADWPFFMWFASHDAHRDWDQGAGAEPPAPSEAAVTPYQVDSLLTRTDIAKYMGEVQRLESSG